MPDPANRTDPTAPEHPTAPRVGPPPTPSQDPFPGLPAPARPAPLRVLVADDNPVVRAGLTALLSGREDLAVVAEAADGRAACEAALRHRPDVVLLDVRMPGVDGLSALPYLVRIAPVMMLTYSGESRTVREALRKGAGGYLVHGEFTADQLADAVRGIGRGRPHFTPTAAQALLAQVRREPGPAGGAEGAGGTDGDEPGATAYRNYSPSGSPACDELPLGERQSMSVDPSTPNSAPEALSQMQPPVAQSSSGRANAGGRPAAPDRTVFHLSRREAEIMDLIASGMTNHQIAGACFISEKTVKNHINRIFAKLHSTSRAEAAAKWLGTAPDSHRGQG
ncbi:Protein-glutamate methylesterase_protein-glutamine glutaminase [Streptomyces sp. enrichment culture]|uniref:response regulator n=1 Tax=Streptomyces sp. enrichment culture TaxID=1795815 RepID=UPI003F552DA6